MSVELGLTLALMLLGVVWGASFAVLWSLLQMSQKRVSELEEREDRRRRSEKSSKEQKGVGEQYGRHVELRREMLKGDEK